MQVFLNIHVFSATLSEESGTDHWTVRWVTRPPFYRHLSYYLGIAAKEKERVIILQLKNTLIPSNDHIINTFMSR